VVLVHFVLLCWLSNNVRSCDQVLPILRVVINIKWSNVAKRRILWQMLFLYIPLFAQNTDDNQ